MTWVRFLPPQFVEVVRPEASSGRRPTGRKKSRAAVDEHSLKTGGEHISLVSSSLTASAFNKRYGPVVQRQRLMAYTQKTMVRVHPGSFRYLALIRQLVERLDLRSSGCEFESHSGHLHEYGSVGNWQTTLFQTQRCCGFESHSSYSSTRPRGAARSARHPVKVEIRGSNPLGDAFYTIIRICSRRLSTGELKWP